MQLAHLINCLGGCCEKKTACCNYYTVNQDIPPGLLIAADAAALHIDRTESSVYDHGGRDNIYLDKYMLSHVATADDLAAPSIDARLDRPKN